MIGGHVEEIKQRLPIDDVIGSYITLERAGKYLRARCPFHNEKSASFYVSPERGTYYCFGCNQKGDIFNFVMTYEGLDFKGALNMLATRAGVEIKQTSHTQNQSKDTKDMLYACLNEATHFFENTLVKDKDALQYLYTRNVSDKTIQNFRIGYAPNNWGDLYKHLKQKSFTDEVISLAGLSIKGENGFYDRFRSRVMFPVEDSSSRVIAFSGRILPQLDDGKTGKYINSPETMLYHKSSVLYGFSKAKEYIRKYDFSILVEGQFDVVLSHQYGFLNTLAVSGTAFTDDAFDNAGTPTHFGILSRISKNIVLALDNDQAGEKAMNRILAMLIPLGMSIKIISKDQEAKDPADILSSPNGVEKWKEIIKNAENPIESLCKRIITSEAKREKQIIRLKQEIFPVAALFTSAVDRLESAKIIEKYFSLNHEYIINDIHQIVDSKKDVNNIPTIKEEYSLNTTAQEQLQSQDLSLLGLYLASNDINSLIYEHREYIHQFLENHIPDWEKHKNQLLATENKDSLVMKIDIEASRFASVGKFIDEILYKYEEFVLRGILNTLRNDLIVNSSDQATSQEYMNIQKKLDQINQKLRLL